MVDWCLYVVADMESKRGLLRFADGVDKLLLLFGTLGCIGDGSMSPLTMFVLSGLMNEYGGAGFALSMDVVDKVYIYAKY
jgi:ATP-binding cassette subfamily B (MDR/TAP) protein 1